MWLLINRARVTQMRVALRLIMTPKKASILMEENSRPKLKKRFRRCSIKGSTLVTSISFFILRSTFLNKLHLKLKPLRKIEMSSTNFTISEWIWNQKESLNWHSRRGWCWTELTHLSLREWNADREFINRKEIRSLCTNLAIWFKISSCLSVSHRLLLPQIQVSSTTVLILQLNNRLCQLKNPFNAKILWKLLNFTINMR